MDWLINIRGGFRGVCTHPLFPETGCPTVYGCPNTSAFLLKKCLHPSPWKFLDPSVIPKPFIKHLHFPLDCHFIIFPHFVIFCNLVANWSSLYHFPSLQIESKRTFCTLWNWYLCNIYVPKRYNNQDCFFNQKLFVSNCLFVCLFVFQISTLGLFWCIPTEILDDITCRL